MPAPKRPTPNHPLAQSAADIEALNAPTPAAVPTPPPAPVPAAVSAPIVTQQLTPPPPPPDPTDRVQHMMDTMMGRLERLNEDSRAKDERIATLDSNRQFLESSLNERNALLERTLAHNAELEARVETETASRGFQSELVDKDHFAEIFRGMQPFFKRINDTMSSVVNKNAELERRLTEAQAAPETAVGKFRKELLDKSVRKDAPEFSSLLKNSKEFLNFLNERIPGSRRTRMQEVQDAWDQEDGQYFVDVVSDFRKLGNPQPVPTADPPRHITEQQPKPPKPDVIVTDDAVQVAFNRVLSGDMRREDFKKLTAIQNQQVAEGRVR